MLNLVIFGPPGAGKGTQAEIIAKQYQLTHLSSGEILRQAVASGNKFGQQIKDYQTRGELVPDELIIEIFKSRLIELEKKNFILDGFPRTLAQATNLDELMAGAPLSAVINLQLPEEEAIKRIVLRGQSSGRTDDNETIARQRFNVYRDQTLPLLDYYRRQDKLIDVDGRPSIEEIANRITDILDELND